MHDLKAAQTPSDTIAPNIAIIGMSGRFPGAANIEEFWRNLIEGRDCVTRFTVQELEAEGIDPMTLADPKYIRAKGLMDDALAFDASLFGFSPRDAEVIDPQQRVFLECALAALEDAGCNPESYEGSIGVYAGQSMSTYMLGIMQNPNVRLDTMQVNIGNDKDFLASRVSYKLDLKGPSVVVQSACSTSLVAVSMAYQSLLDYQCDVALAGGVCVTFPERDGYMHEPGGNTSADGYLRAFDERATGLVGGTGVGVVVLKRLEDAIADRDNIHAVILGCAVNNDGSLKVGYTAPSVDGQAEAVATAHALGDIDPASISYVEAHGTGTRIGDPIEVAALTKAFRRKTTKTGYCGLGAVKTNIGHLDAAAGVAGLIKAVLAMRHRTIPANLHYEKPNPEIDFDTSPFYAVQRATPWRSDDGMPLRAGISSFAIGGGNAHIVIEEPPPPPEPETPERDLAILTLSANGPAALERGAAAMSAFLQGSPDTDLADAAYTLQVGRKARKHRLAVVCGDPAEAVDRLSGITRDGTARGMAEADPRVVFLFPGQGAQYVGMTRGLYEAEPTYREVLDECAELLRPEIGRDLRTLLFAAGSDAEAAAQLDQTGMTQPALFAVEYALAKLWMSWGIQPAGMIGHSLGEYVAACLSDVIDLASACRLIGRRGALMQSLPTGEMASVPLSDDELTPLLTPGLSLAAVLGSSLCVVSGASGELEALRERLAGHGIVSQPIRTSHAFHSAAMDPILPAFVEAFEGVSLRRPRIPFISNVTGTWITDADAVDPQYWARQLRNTVRLRDGLAELTRPPGTICVEVGPGRSLSALSHQAVEGRRIDVVATCRDRLDPTPDVRHLMGAVGKLWTLGGDIDWATFSEAPARRKLALPTYSFEREVYSLLPSRTGGAMPAEQGGQRGRSAVSDLIFAPTWKRANALSSAAVTADADARWLVFLDPTGLGERCAERLRSLGQSVVTVDLEGDAAGAEAADHRLAAISADAVKQLFVDLEAAGGRPSRILHFWTFGTLDASTPFSERLARCRVRGLDSLLYIAQVLGAGSTAPCQLTVVTSGTADVLGTETLEPEKSIIAGPARAVPEEHQHVASKILDVLPADPASLSLAQIDMLLAEAMQPSVGDVALRGMTRWARSFESVYFSPHGDPPPELPQRLRENGTYLITGGLGGIGLAIAVHLAEKVKARVVLTGRTLPTEESEAAAAAIGVPTVADRLAAIEKAGGAAMVAKADVTDAAAMADVVARAREKFGTIHGVIHSAGLPTHGIMQLKTAADVDRVLAAKVQGTAVLHDLFADSGLDFLVLCSSVSSVIGASGLTEYTSANAFLDTFANQHSRSYARVVSINYDTWAGVGMSVRMSAAHPDAAATVAMRGLEPADGVAGFELALNSVGPQLAVALGPFEWISRYGPPRDQQAAGQGPEQSSYSRPDLGTVFEAPTTDLEIGVAALFHEVLGIKDIGIHDNFFDLGGHSLVGVRLVNRILETYGVEVGIAELFDLPTVRALSLTIVDRSRGPAAPAAPAERLVVPDPV